MEGIVIFIVGLITGFIINKIYYKTKSSIYRVYKNIPQGLKMALTILVFILILFCFLLYVFIPVGLGIMNKHIYKVQVLDNTNIKENISYLIKIFSLLLTILGAFFTANNYLLERKSRVITENRIEWMYKIREYIIELSSDIKKYLICSRQSYKKLKKLKYRIENDIERIILHLSPKKNNDSGKNELDDEFEQSILTLKKYIDEDFNNGYDVSKRTLITDGLERVLYISRIYFKIEWEKVKYEAINDSHDLYDTDREYKNEYKKTYEEEIEVINLRNERRI